MKKYSTMILKIAIVLICIPIIAVTVLVLPAIVVLAFQEMQTGSTLAVMILGILAIVYLSLIPFFMALYQALKLLGYIDKKQAFSDLSVHALKKIKQQGWVIAGLYAVTLPFFYGIAEWDDAPGLIVVGLVVSGAAFVVAIFANVLELLLEEAIRLKNENDLTV